MVIIRRGPIASLEGVYRSNPMPPELAQEERRHVLGLQANVWTEHIRTEDRLTYMIFPRAAAVAELKRGIFAQASAQLGVPAETLALRDKHVVGDGVRVSLAELARQSQAAGGGLIAHGTFVAPPTPHDPKRVEAHVYPAFHSPSFHAHAVDLSVDDETGEVAIHRYVVAQDVGFAMNPTYIEGQIEGGVAQGLGQALSEEIVYAGGRVLNANLTDYKMPTALDMPRVQSILVQHPSLVGPYGAKGVGEPPNIEPPAAVANAAAAATGCRVTALPITAERIALQRRAEAGEPA